MKGCGERQVCPQKILLSFSYISYMHLCLFINMYLHLFTNMHLYIYIYLYTCIYIYLEICIYIHLYMHFFLHTGLLKLISTLTQVFMLLYGNYTLIK